MIRQFIDELMTNFYGSKWPKSKLPNNLCRAWEEKKSNDKENGHKHQLIEYADFTDYSSIICKKDNWKEVFSNFLSEKKV